MPTLKGLVQKYAGTEDIDFPISNLPATAARPARVKASLTGVIKKGLASNIERDSALTLTVGDLGDIESALRKNKKERT